MFEMNSDILVLAVGLVLGLLIIKLLAKFIFRLVATLLLLIIGFTYVYFYTDFFEEHQDNAIVAAVEDKIDFVSIIDFQNEHCQDGPKSRTDSITCECIIAPLVDDLNSKFTQDEIEALKRDKERYLKEILAALKRNQNEITKELKKRKATHIWNDMVKNLKRGTFIGNY
jgi:hypothetical protein